MLPSTCSLQPNHSTSQKKITRKGHGCRYTASPVTDRGSWIPPLPLPLPTSHAHAALSTDPVDGALRKPPHNHNPSAALTPHPSPPPQRDILIVIVVRGGLPYSLQLTGLSRLNAPPRPPPPPPPTLPPTTHTGQQQ
eukprot:scaffold271843_cov23-Tisochrysis_lutea.AAC.1